LPRVLEREPYPADNPGRESSWRPTNPQPAPISTLDAAAVNSVEYPLPVHSRSSPTPCSMPLGTRFSHRPSGLHRPFRDASGKRGKAGTSNAGHNPDLQISRFAPSGFGKLTPDESPSIQGTSPLFPLFRLQLRVLLSFLLIFHCFSFTVAICAPVCRAAPSGFRPAFVQPPAQLPRRNAQESRQAPRFPRAGGRPSEYNQKRPNHRCFRVAALCSTVWPAWKHINRGFFSCRKTRVESCRSRKLKRVSRPRRG